MQNNLEKGRQMKITVITPTYNRADLISKTIESVLNQDFQDFEYLILDDGSTDNTEEIVRPYLKDKRVSYLKHENAGEAETVNWGWILAKGEYFTQVNSDDPILPGLFSEMVKVLDDKKNVVVAYPNFYFINEKGEIIKKEPTPDWIFLDAIRFFSCYAASAGTFIRKSTFCDWEKIKNPKFKHISDIDMYWKMALKGDFWHVPKFLATWRSHSESISAERYKCIPEVHIWFQEYFSRKDLPKEILISKEKVKREMHNYCFYLLKQSELKNKDELSREYCQQYIYKSENLQINDNDLIGNKFNGHDSHLYLRERGINSKQLVWNKESNDENTYQIARNRPNRNEIYEYAQHVQRQYSLDGTLNPIGYDILFDQLFLDTELIHLHLVHNHIFDIQLLPLMSRLKPIVWTLHDPWALGGHCVHHFECEKWKKQCGDCPTPKAHFGLQLDNSALNFALKKDVIRNSKLEIIVASEWMKKKIEQSPIFEGKKINVIPFGINQEIFKPISKVEARKNLGIQNDALIFSFRCDPSEFKGLDYVEYVLRKVQTNKKVVLLVLANKLRENPRKFEAKEYGWVNDDNLLSQIYSASDLFLMPSTVEAFGMMAIEAMSCETLPIVLDGTALPDTVNASECGVSTKRDKNDYLKAVQYYIDHKDKRNERAKKCLEFAKENYNKDVYVDRLIEVYVRAIAKHKVLEEDRFLLDQLKKNAVFEVDNKIAQGNDSVKFLEKNTSIISIIKYKLFLLFLKYKEFFPKKIRTTIRKKLIRIEARLKFLK